MNNRTRRLRALLLLGVAVLCAGIGWSYTPPTR